VAAIAITVVTAGTASWASEAIIAGDASATAEAGAAYASIVVAGGSAAGYVQTGNMKGAVLGGLEAGLDVGINAQVSYSGNAAGNVAAHAVSGGVLEVLRGGKFGHGFVSAGLFAAVSPNLKGDRFAQGVQATILGGSISQLTGGKFANGAVSAVFQQAFSAVAGLEKVAPDEAYAERASTFDPATALAQVMIEPFFRNFLAEPPVVPFDEINIPTDIATASGKLSPPKPASEQVAKDMARQIEKDISKDARKEFHDLKDNGGPDRTMEQLKAQSRMVWNSSDQVAAGGSQGFCGRCLSLAHKR